MVFLRITIIIVLILYVAEERGIFFGSTKKPFYVPWIWGIAVTVTTVGYVCLCEYQMCDIESVRPGIRAFYVVIAAIVVGLKMYFARVFNRNVENKK